MYKKENLEAKDFIDDQVYIKLHSYCKMFEHDTIC
jgi:hypothetical protein